jgi:hypothetical protein
MSETGSGMNKQFSEPHRWISGRLPHGETVLWIGKPGLLRVAMQYKGSFYGIDNGEKVERLILQSILGLISTSSGKGL